MGISGWNRNSKSGNPCSENGRDGDCVAKAGVWKCVGYGVMGKKKNPVIGVSSQIINHL